MSAPEIDEDLDTSAEVLVEAETVNATVCALVEVLSSCEEGTKLTASLLVALLVDVKARMFNVVDGLRAIERRAA